MRRATARGRVYPQSNSTDRRFGRLSLKAIGLYPFMWSNADDQGRLTGDPEEIKYSCCPNVDHITKQDIPAILKELNDNGLISWYDTPAGSSVIQMLDWWGPHNNLQWSWPSDYPAAEGWQDHLRYKVGPKNVVTINWPPPERSGENSGVNSGEKINNSQVNNDKLSGENSGVNSGENSGEDSVTSPLTTPFFKTETETEIGRGRGKSPEDSAEEPNSTSFSDEENPSPSHIVSPVKLMKRLTKCFRMEWGRVPADNPDEVIPREPDARENAQLRDLSKELSKAGGCPLDYIDQAFQEAAGHQKMYVSYVRKVLFAWLGVEVLEK